MSVAPETDLGEALQRYFGYSEFKPGQLEVMERLLAGQSAAAVFPTGGGKSLCYQLPSLLLPGLTLVVSPLIALMKDQIDALLTRGIPAARLDSTLSADEFRSVMDQVRGGQLRMLYVAPERFNNERFRETIQRIDISLFAVDEAHCISEWGHAFRPDYLKLAAFARQCGAERTLALTATATDQVLEDICRFFEITPDCAVRTSFYRPNLTLRFSTVEEDDRDGLLIDRLKGRPLGPTIVYVTLQKTAERVAKLLSRAGLDAKPYHAGMESKARTATQNWFLQSDRSIVVATIAFGMGIDKSNIRYVYHFNLPKSLENFAQEIGRAGRDGKPSVCEMFLCLDDLNTLENFVYGDTPTRDSVRRMLAELFGLGNNFDVNIYDLSRDNDIKPLVVKTLLTYLELDGWLEGGTPIYSKYQFKPILSSAEILAQFEGERRAFLESLFRLSKKAKTWLHIDLDKAVKKLQTSRSRIVSALDYLGEKQMLEVRSTDVRLKYRLLAKPPQLAQTANELHTRMTERESRDINRLGQVVELVAHDGCQVSMLGQYFGEPLSEPCGHCSWCEDSSRTHLKTQRVAPAIDDQLWQQALALREQHQEVLGDSRKFARFLCGVSSPQLSKSKLNRETLFGAFENIPFQQILSRAEET